MRILRSAAVASLALALITPANSQASEKPAVLSQNSATETELAPGESVTFQKGDVVKVEMLPNGPSEKIQVRSADLTTAPNCIVAKAEKGFVQVYNNCGGNEPQRIKVTLAFGPDSVCKSIEPGTRSNVGPALGRIDGVYLC
ncbi:hypothetical protein FHE74_10355 [Corynebacterium tapiri]|uniref:Secreted protein n=1 Tax=Corynebacterium tapiri TaxID=1448266 RepID=A0A5C4U363_9CORY|nr:hypothetical protein FHE74_10355 [Corynebacterium tapiri]